MLRDGHPTPKLCWLSALSMRFGSALCQLLPPGPLGAHLQGTPGSRGLLGPQFGLRDSASSRGGKRTPGLSAEPLLGSRGVWGRHPLAPHPLCAPQPLPRPRTASRCRRCSGRGRSPWQPARRLCRIWPPPDHRPRAPAAPPGPQMRVPGEEPLVLPGHPLSPKDTGPGALRLPPRAGGML